MPSPRFIHLRVHTEFSLLEGAVPVKKLVGLCDKMQMPAVAVTTPRAARYLFRLSLLLCIVLLLFVP